MTLARMYHGSTGEAPVMKSRAFKERWVATMKPVSNKVNDRRSGLSDTLIVWLTDHTILQNAAMMEMVWRRLGKEIPYWPHAYIILFFLSFPNLIRNLFYLSSLQDIERRMFRRNSFYLRFLICNNP